MDKKHVLVMFGGKSSEHEVSIITALQVLESMDKKLYIPIPIYQDKQGVFKYLRNFKTKKDFLTSSRKDVKWGSDDSGGYIQLGAKRIYPYAAYLAYHGGPGECGDIQGFLESLSIPFTSSATESMVLTANKSLTKIIADKHGIPTLPFVAYKSDYAKRNLEKVVSEIEKNFDYPMILKPSHLGSSIGIKVAKNKEELFLIISSLVLLDNEFLVEKYLKNFDEYNCSVMKVGEEFLFSAIEKPIRENEILSFSNKYEDPSASKITSGQGGMANLARELPARLTKKKEEKILSLMKEVYFVFDCEGVVRIDCIADGEEIFLNEINRIPGSMAFYLWEAVGDSFTKQISRSIEESIKSQQYRDSFAIDYDTDIVEKFINSADL